LESGIGEPSPSGPGHTAGLSAIRISDAASPPSTPVTAMPIASEPSADATTGSGAPGSDSSAW
jgi:hypothetical protein